jgi:hypothetical protein
MENKQNNEIKAKKKKWNGKVITTSKQWLHNDSGSREALNCSYRQILEAADEYINSSKWF